MDLEQDYYLPSEITPLLKKANMSKTSFYDYVKKGEIEKIIRENREAYSKVQVDAFLARKRITNGRRKRNTIHKQEVVKDTAQGLVIDMARYNDLFYLYGLESLQLDPLRAIVPPVLYSWQQVNDSVYWLQFNSENRQEITAMLGILPLQEEVVQQLHHKEISFSQIPASSVLTYESGKNYHCYITSAATKLENKDAIMSLMERVFRYWQEHSISIDGIYASVDSTEDSPLLRLVTNCAFMPLNSEADQFLLRPIHRAYQTVDFVKTYRDNIQNLGKKQSEDHVPTLVLEQSQTKSLDELRKIYQKSLSRKRDEAFTNTVHALVDVTPDGHITRRDGFTQHQVWVGRIRNDDDIRATLRINASLFGSSQKYTEDQLVEFRRAWLKKNQDIYRILEIDGEVLGFIFAMPLPKRVIDRVLSGEIKVGDISLEDLQEYKPNQSPVDVYLQTLGLHKKIQGGDKVFAGTYLIAGMERLITDIGEHGVEIGSIFTLSDEADGVRMAAMLGFDEIAAPVGVQKLVYQLDSSKEKPSLRAYKHALEAYKRKHATV